MKPQGIAVFTATMVDCEPSNSLNTVESQNAAIVRLGAIVAAERPQPVARLTRDLGGNRQNVQRFINDLEREGLVAFAPNPHHKRAQLVVLSDKGKRAFRSAMDLQAPWANDLADGVSVKDLETLHRVILALRNKLEGDEGSDA